jgi:hypothetical protein
MASIPMVILYIVFLHGIKLEESLFCIGDGFPENHTLPRNTKKKSEQGEASKGRGESPGQEAFIKGVGSLG